MEQLEVHNENSWLLKFGKLTKAHSLGSFTKVSQHQSTKPIVQGIRDSVSGELLIKLYSG